MILSKINHTDSSYPKAFRGVDLVQFNVCTAQGEQVGQVIGVLENRAEHLYYLGVDLGFLQAGKQVLLPMERVRRIDPVNRNVYAQIEDESQFLSLPNFNQGNARANQKDILEKSNVDTGLYTSGLGRPTTSTTLVTRSEVTDTEKQEWSNAPVPNQSIAQLPSVQPASNQNNDLTIQLLAERVVAHKNRRKIGEIVVRKEIETRYVQVPIRWEKLIVEQVGAETKQLAVVNLGNESDTEAQLQNLINFSTVDLEAKQSSVLSQTALDQRAASEDNRHQGSAPIMSAEFSSAHAASRFLEEIAEQWGSQKVQIKIEVVPT